MLSKCWVLLVVLVCLGQNRRNLLILPITYEVKRRLNSCWPRNKISHFKVPFVQVGSTSNVWQIHDSVSVMPLLLTRVPQPKGASLGVALESAVEGENSAVHPLDAA